MRHKKEISKFNITGDIVHKYVNFINDHDLGDKLELYETGFINGDFYLEVEGKTDLINSIKCTKILKDDE